MLGFNHAVGKDLAPFSDREQVVAEARGRAKEHVQKLDKSHACGLQQIPTFSAVDIVLAH